MKGALARPARPAPLLRTVASAAIMTSVGLAPTAARAQIHWDASAQAGVLKRALGDRPAGGGDAGVGPIAQLSGHFALLPLVRAGAYFGHDISPLGGSSARDLTWGGVRLKAMSPWPRGALRAWLWVGFGYAGTYQRSAAVGPTLVHGAGGGFFELPFGIGASYKIRKPWELCAELVARYGFGHTGSAYEAPGPRVSSPGRDDVRAPPAGDDRFALGLLLGVLVDL